MTSADDAVGCSFEARTGALDVHLIPAAEEYQPLADLRRARRVETTPIHAVFVLPHFAVADRT